MLDVALSVKALSSVKSLQMTEKCTSSLLTFKNNPLTKKKKKNPVPATHLFLFSVNQVHWF